MYFNNTFFSENCFLIFKIRFIHQRIENLNFYFAFLPLWVFRVYFIVFRKYIILYTQY